MAGTASGAYRALRMAACLAAALLPAAAVEAGFNRTPGSQGYVVSYFWQAMVPADQDHCPRGFTIDAGTAFLNSLPSGSKERIRLSKAESYTELYEYHASDGPKGENLCRTPWVVADPGMNLVEGGFAYGMDLDGGQPSCRHAEFTGPKGEPGIDNQLYRLLGCIKGYQPNEAAETYHMNAYKVGERTTLIEVTGLDDKRNDPDVQVAVMLSPDLPPLAANGTALHNASLRVTDKAQYRNQLHGKIVDGVLTTEPQDLRLPMTSGPLVTSEYLIKAARLRLELQPDGSLKGMLAGYFDTEKFFEQISMPGTRDGAVKGGATNFGYSCPGLWYALQRLADGNPDASGKCTSISTAFRVEAVPAFVIHSEARTAEASR